MFINYNIEECKEEIIVNIALKDEGNILFRINRGTKDGIDKDDQLMLLESKDTLSYDRNWGNRSVGTFQEKPSWKFLARLKICNVYHDYTICQPIASDDGSSTAWFDQSSGFFKGIFLFGDINIPILLTFKKSSG